MRRKATFVLALVLAIPITLKAMDAVPASAASPRVNGTDTVSCTSATGSLKFGPSLTKSGTASETATVKVRFVGCNASVSNVTTVDFSGKAEGTITWSSNNCSALSGPNPVSGTLAIEWSAKAGSAKLNPTMVSLTTVAGFGSGQNGNVGISFANQAASGSFPRPLQAELDSNENLATASGPTGCGARKGLKKLAIVAGDLRPAPPPVRAYVSSTGANNVTPLALATGTLGAPIPVGVTPLGIAITPNGLTAYVANNPGSVTPINLVTDTPGAAIPVGPSSWSVAATPDGSTVYATSGYNNDIVPIDTTTNRPGTPIPAGKFPTAIAITPDGHTAYVAGGGSSGTVTPINLVTATPGSPIPVGLDPQGIAITPDGRVAFVANFNSNSVTPIDIASNAAGTPIPVGVDPFDVAITPDGSSAWVTNQGDNTVTMINIAQRKPMAVIGGFGTDPSGIAITPDGATAYVAVGGGTPSMPNSVTPLNLGTRTLGTPIPLPAGSSPEEIAIG